MAPVAGADDLKGEPPVRVVAKLGEELYELDDLPHTDRE